VSVSSTISATEQSSRTIRSSSETSRGSCASIRPPLPRNREAVLRGALKSLAGKYKGEWTVALLKHEIDKWRNLDAEGMYAPYCQVVVQYLEKKLRQRQGA
jgi:hypothetical protein